MRRLILPFLISATLSAQAVFDTYFVPGTLRIDYAQSGGAYNVKFNVLQITKEPFWGGPRHNLTDDFNFGNYRVVVFDSLSQKEIFSRGFSSLFAEWQFTEEAQTKEERFLGTIIMPMPQRTVKIVFYHRDAYNNWEALKHFFVNPASDVKPNHHPHIYETAKIAYHGHPANKLDIAFIAEGYTEDELIKFVEDCHKLADILFDTEPFKRNKENINIWAVKAVSKESGVSNPAANITVNTVLKASFNTFNIERYLMLTDHYTLRDIASNVPYDHIYVVVNTDDFGGGGIYNFFSIGTTHHPLAGYLLSHEFGHTLGGLADEYVSEDTVFAQIYDKMIEPWEANITTLVDFEKKWYHKVDKDTPIPTPEHVEGDVIGAFEGAGYNAQGIYRPMKNCMMRSAKDHTFCTICDSILEAKILYFVR